MKTAKLFVLGLVLLSFTVLSQEANGQRFKLPFGKPKASTVQDVQLADNSGPWLIMCASFTGDDGKLQAERLAQELRDNYRMPAYVYSHEFDHARKAAENGIGWKPTDEASPKLKKKVEMVPVSEEQTRETAVLVGDFASIDDGRAQDALKKIKTIQPQSMIDSVLADSTTFRGSTAKNNRGEKLGPFRAAFLMPNPKLPESYFQARQLDESQIKWNRDAKNSLLKNPGTYTVKIATFSTRSTFESSVMKKRQAEMAWMKKNRQENEDSSIVAATKKAFALAAYLRKQGIDAYEFHDRTESGVYVGSFDYLVKDGINGRTENPEVIRTINKFKGTVINLGNGQQGHKTYELPQRLHEAGIHLDVLPIPVIVPKAPERTAMSRLRLR